MRKKEKENLNFFFLIVEWMNQWRFAIIGNFSYDRLSHDLIADFGVLSIMMIKNYFYKFS